MKPIKKLLMPILLIAPLWSGCASTDQRSPSNIVSEPKVAKNFEKVAETPKPKCDDLLNECVVVLEQHHEAIKAQKEVIELQDGLIAVQEVQVETEEKAKKQWTAIAGLEAFLLALLILL